MDLSSMLNDAAPSPSTPPVNRKYNANNNTSRNNSLSNNTYAHTMHISSEHSYVNSKQYTPHQQQQQQSPRPQQQTYQHATVAVNNSNSNLNNFMNNSNTPVRYGSMNVNDPRTRDRANVYQISTSLQYLIEKDAINSYPNNNGHLKSGVADINTTASTSSTTTPTSSTANDTATKKTVYQANDLPINGATGLENVKTLGPDCIEHWRPKISFANVFKAPQSHLRPTKRLKTDDNQQSNTIMQLKLHELRLRKDDPVLVIEDSYEIMGEHKRSYYALISQCNQNHHHFVFQPENLENNHPWMDELNGLRETAYFCMRSVKNEIYEVHLKPTKEKTYFFGYIVKQDVFEKNMRDSVEELLHFRRLPLVLDLDDTLVRLVGEGNERFVPEADLPKCRDRVARLKDGRRIVLAERVQEFLDWAQNLFQISVCSLGDQEYVTNVVDVLDPLKTRIKGPIYSARHEHEYIRKSIDPSRPPKDLRALFTYCNLTDNSFGSGTSLPLILDDETRMWPADQHDNIIEVIGQPNSSVWSVALFPVVKDTLEHVHREFFRQYDQWCLRSNEAKTRGQIYTRPGPSAVVMYKTYLRHILRDMIGKSPVYRNAAPYA